MTRPKAPPHDGTVANPSSFNQALHRLIENGASELTTSSGTPFTAQAHIPSKGSHAGEQSILITRDGSVRAYIYECCWGHITNCTRTYIDVYTPQL